MAALEGRGFLLPTGKRLDAYAWSVRKSDSAKNPVHHAQLDLRIGNNKITLHTHNEGLDTDFRLFKAKLQIVLHTITDFVGLAPHYNFQKNGQTVDRTWLNPDDSIDAMFTGSIVTIYGETECMLELSSCDRSTRFYVTPAKKNHIRTADQTDLGLLTGIKRSVVEVLEAIESLVNPKQPDA